ncbi:hypothetical protein K3495_g10243 [Podosphaera aphanis]|nr:hypothetical protein K3495_g10243 [Podosphaera aphanis]
MEISDILSDLDSRHQERVPYNENDLESNKGGEAADLQALTRAWVNERGTKELLAWPRDGLITRCNARIQAQISRIEEMTGDMDPKTNFSLVIIQTDVERWRYLVRSYLRARLAKIDKYALFYLSSPHLEARLSELEVAYATQHQQLLHQHYLSSFLGTFPRNLQNLNDAAGGITMIEGPDEQTGVFVRGLGSRRGEETVFVAGRDRDGGGEIGVARGEVVVAKWADVRECVENGEMELV